jgi:uncharacterized protein
MAYNDASVSSPPSSPPSPTPLPTTVKLLVAGGFGVGKTTFIGSVSEIEPLTTEEIITEASAGIDDLEGVEAKTTTTVAFDFGRITLNPSLVLYLFGTPGQDRFHFMWEELCLGALGAVVLADTRRLQQCFGALDFFERHGIRFVVAVNEFDGSYEYGAEEVRLALDLKPHVPVVLCDARQPRSATAVIIRLIQHLLEATMAPVPS